LSEKSLPAFYKTLCNCGAVTPFFGKEMEEKMDKRTTVLYVDDNPKSSRLLASVLEECGFRVNSQNDPMESLALCKHAYFDLALVDYEMPGMTGSQLAHEIKNLSPEMPVVLISGRTKLPAKELEFVDFHFGGGTSLDDLVWTMRALSHSRTDRQPRIDHQPTIISSPDHRTVAREMARWADST
jgi:CheY-like chemotaxis protein